MEPPTARSFLGNNKTSTAFPLVEVLL